MKTLKTKTATLILVVGLLYGCSSEPTPQEGYNIPKNATIIEDVGNGWVIFELKNKKFLYKFNDRKAYRSYAALTQIVD